MTWLESLFYREEPADVPVLASVGRTLPLVGFSWTLENRDGWVEVTQGDRTQALALRSLLYYGFCPTLGTSL